MSTNAPGTSAGSSLRIQGQPARKPGDFWTSFLPAALLIFFATLVSYHAAATAGFIWDDDSMLTENELISGGLRDIWFSTKFYDYYPLTLTSLWIEWRIFGMHPGGYHIVNIVFHALTAIFFWRVLLRLKIPGAWFAGLIFALHPVGVESVAWIAERKNTLPMVFYALSLLWFLRSEQENEAAPKNSGTKWYWLSLVAFALALLSKTSVVMLPFVLLGCVWWQREKIQIRDLLRAAPFFLLSLTFGLITIWVQYNRAISTDSDVIQIGNFAERMARAGWAVWFYLFKTLVPWKLAFVYPRWEVNPQSFVSWLPGITLIAAFGLFWKFRKTWGKPLLFGLGYFVLTLFPVLGFFKIYFQKYSFVADHWQYTSIIGVIALVVGAAMSFKKKLPWMPIIVGALAIFLGALTFKQTLIYENDETLWRDTIRKNPKASIAYHNLGSLMLERGEVSEATRLFETTLAVKPDHEGAHYNLATILIVQGKTAEAISHLRDSIKSKPDYSMALNTLAWILATHPNPEFRNGDEAVELAERAVKLSEGKNVNHLETLSAAYAEARRFGEAIQTCDKAIHLAEASGESEIKAGLEEHRRFYQSRRPVRERFQ